MAGQIKVDSINADSNLALKIANTAVAFIDSSGLRPVSGNVNLDVTATSKVFLPSANTVEIQTAGVTGLSMSSSQVVTLANALPVGSGGTGATSLSAITTGTATNLAGGTNGTIPYQSAAGTTQMLAVGTSGQVLQTNGAGAPSWATVSAGFTLGTPVVSTSGTSITFTGIPAGTKQIIVSFRGVSTSGTSAKVIRLGDAGGIETTGYISVGASVVNGTSLITNGFSINSTLASDVINGSVRLTLENSTNYEWVASGTFGISGGSTDSLVTSGGKALSAELDRISVTTQNGTDTFDAGEINIAYM